MTEQTDENGRPLTYWGGLEEPKEEILIPVTPNVECRDGKEIGVWMEGWLQGYKEAQGQYETKETLYTEEDMLNFAKFVYEDDGSVINNDGTIKKGIIEQFKNK